MGPDNTRRESIDDLDALLSALPSEIVAAVHALPNKEDVIEVVLDLGRRPEARFPDAEVTLLEREITEVDIADLAEYALGVIADRTGRGSGHRSDQGVIAPVRTYESPIDRRLEEAGFDTIASVTLLMKETVVRVAEPALVPAVR